MQRLITTINKSLGALVLLLLFSGVTMAQDVTLSFGGDIDGRQGDEVTIPVKVTDLTNKNVSNFDFEIAYDADLMEVSVDNITAGDMLDAGITKNVTDDHRILVSYASSKDLDGSGTLFTIKATLKGKGVNEAGVSVTDYLIGDGSLDVAPDVPYNLRVLVADLAIELPDFEGYVGQSKVIAITNDTLSAEDIISYDLGITYDPDVMDITGVETAGTLTEGASVEFNKPEDGRVLISASFTNAITSNSTTFLKLNVSPVTQAEASTLGFSKVDFFDSQGNQVPVAGLSGKAMINSAISEMSIADARAADVGTAVTVTGVVTRSMGAFTRIQDESAGITIYQTSGAFYDAVANGDVKQGDRISVTGKTSEFASLLEIGGSDIISFEVMEEGVDLPAPQEVTLAEIAANGEEYESELIKIDGLTLQDNEVSTFEAATTYQLTEGYNDTSGVALRTPNADDSEVDGQQVPEYFVFTGVLGQFSFDDPNMGYQLQPVLASDIEVGTPVEKTNNSVPQEYKLYSNYPNPFNPTTNIKFALPQASNVKVDVYNMLGRKVSTLVNKNMAAGNHTIQFDASKLTSGMYLYRIQAGSFTEVKKMMLLK